MNAKKGNDKIYLKGGNWSQINAGAGNDTITVYKGNSHSIDVGSGKKDKVIIKGGNRHVIGNFSGEETGTGHVTITIYKGKHHAVNAGYLKKNVTVNLKGGNADSILTWGGNDTIVVSGKATLSNKAWEHLNTADKCGIDTGSGNDEVKFKANAGNGIIAYVGNGDDVITILGGNKHQVHTGAGKDKVNISGGTRHAVYLDDGINNVTVTNTRATIYTGDLATDNITVKWNKKGINNYTIKTPEVVSTNVYGYTDTLTVKGISSSDVTFVEKNGTLVMSAAGGSISIDHFDEYWKWNNSSGTTNFGNGIKFDDGILSLSDIHNRTI